MAEISRLIQGASGEFEVEVIFARNGEATPRVEHPYREIIVIAEGSISIERSDSLEPDFHVATEMVQIPAGVTHLFRAHATPTRLVVIRPERR